MVNANICSKIKHSLKVKESKLLIMRKRLILCCITIFISRSHCRYSNTDKILKERDVTQKFYNQLNCFLSKKQKKKKKIENTKF